MNIVHGHHRLSVYNTLCTSTWFGKCFLRVPSQPANGNPHRRPTSSFLPRIDVTGQETGGPCPKQLRGVRVFHISAAERSRAAWAFGTRRTCVEVERMGGVGVLAGWSRRCGLSCARGFLGNATFGWSREGRGERGCGMQSG